MSGWIKRTCDIERLTRFQ